MIPAVELVYAPGCPNVRLARERLRVALLQIGVEPRWTEWDRTSAGAPMYTRDYASPTVLIDGCDVDPSGNVESGDACRLYEGRDGGFVGAPSVETILDALERARKEAR